MFATSQRTHFHLNVFLQPVVVFWMIKSHDNSSTTSWRLDIFEQKNVGDGSSEGDNGEYVEMKWKTVSAWTGPSMQRCTQNANDITYTVSVACTKDFFITFRLWSGCPARLALEPTPSTECTQLLAKSVQSWLKFLNCRPGCIAPSQHQSVKLFNSTMNDFETMRSQRQ